MPLRLVLGTTPTGQDRLPLPTVVFLLPHLYPPCQVFLRGLDLATCPQISGYACFPLNKSQVIF